MTFSNGTIRMFVLLLVFLLGYVFAVCIFAQDVREKPPLIHNVPTTPGFYKCSLGGKSDIAAVYEEGSRLMVTCNAATCPVEDFYRYSKERDKFIWGDRLTDEDAYRYLKNTRNLRGTAFVYRVAPAKMVRLKASKPQQSVVEIEKREIAWKIVEEPKLPYVRRGALGFGITADRVIVPRRTTLSVEQR